MRQPGKHALAFVALTVLIDTMGFGIIIPVTPGLIVELAGVPLAEATSLGGWLFVTYALLQFVCGPVAGNLSDRFGRRPVLLASLFAFGLDYFFMALAPSLGWLFLGRAIAGMAGAVYSPAYAYVADVAPPEKRAASFGWIGAAFGLGFILGPALGGLLGELGHRAPFYAAAALAGLNFLYGLLVLPESLAPENRRPFSWARANPLGTLVTFRSYRTVTALAAAVLLWQVAHQVYPSTWSFYTMLRFGWSASDIGWSLAFAGLLMAMVQGKLTGALVARWGERRAAVIGLVSGVLGFLGCAFALHGWMLFAAILVGALQGLVYPSLNALMSRQVPANAQGELQGGVASLYSLSSIVGPFALTQVLAFFSRPGAPVHFPGAAFLVSALLALGCMAILLSVIQRSESVERTPAQPPTP